MHALGRRQVQRNLSQTIGVVLFSSKTANPGGEDRGHFIEPFSSVHQIGIESVLVHCLRFMLLAELGLTLVFRSKQMIPIGQV